MTSFLDLDYGEISRLADELHSAWRVAEVVYGWSEFALELFGLWRWAEGLSWAAPDGGA